MPTRLSVEELPSVPWCTNRKKDGCFQENGNGGCAWVVLVPWRNEFLCMQAVELLCEEVVDLRKRTAREARVQGQAS